MPRAEFAYRRSPSRGTTRSCTPDLRGGKWLHFIEEAGLQWMIDAAAYRGPSVDYAKVHWDDFRRVDLVLALRPLERALSMAKPATKLQNAWAAAVPAILGPERPYRELRRSDLDYIEVRNGDSAIKAVRYLRDHPSIYRAMVENGRGRARDFTVARTIGVWMTLLFETIPAAASDRRIAPTAQRADFATGARQVGPGARHRGGREAAVAMVSASAEVSVVTPTRNRLSMLQQAVDSVLRQTFDAWELVVVDDASDDGTWEWLSSLSNPRIRSFRLEERGEQSRARNTGVKASTAPIVVSLDDDDLLTPTALGATCRGAA